jgi:hypothetical protein
MKKITLLAASIFLFGGIVANADERNHRNSAFDLRNGDPIVFTERGIEFYVFADGQFDFNARPSNGHMYYKSNRKNKFYDKPGKGPKWNYGVDVEQDRNGNIRRIGNVLINYDSRNRVNRIGTVYMDYNRYCLTQVGGLQIVYNHNRQIVDIFGTVNSNRVNQISQYNNDDHCNVSNQEDFNYNSRDQRPNRVVASVGVRINR